MAQMTGTCAGRVRCEDIGHQPVLRNVCLVKDTLLVLLFHEYLLVHEGAGTVKVPQLRVGVLVFVRN